MLLKIQATLTSCLLYAIRQLHSFTFTLCFVEVAVHCLDLAHPQKVFTVSLKASFGYIHCSHLLHCFHCAFPSLCPHVVGAHR